MMKLYQPIDLHPSVRAIFTSATEGSIATGAGKPDETIHTENRNALVTSYFSSKTHTKIVIRYSDTMTYTHVERLTDITSPHIECDALYTTIPGAVMVLPVADCVATLVYDPLTSMLGILHLGRHSSVAGLIEHFVIEVADTLGSDPRNWHVWMSPSLKQPHDRMEYFTPPNHEEWKDFINHEEDGIYIDVAGHNVQRFVRAGVDPSRIYNAPEDTYEDRRFFSQRASDELGDHSRYGRMMLAASLLTNKQVS